MSFIKGLHNRVDVIPIVKKTSNRITKDQMMNDMTKTISNIPCRIIDEEKALFLPNIELKEGYVIKDTSTSKKYEIESVTPVFGKKRIHHFKCDIRKAPEK